MIGNSTLASNRATERGEIAMDSAARRIGGGIWEGLYRVIMRRNSVYVTFVVLGAFAGERAVDYGVHKLWEINNVGKRYEDIPVLGQRPSEE
ncbi:Cytochrome b-c1 complex subunit 9, mitochondrial [Dionaea muscipula]